MAETEQGAEPLYPIRTVASITGVTPVTLRAWERRYGFVRPKRAPSGHRLYSREDVALVRRAVALLDRGVPLSRVGPMLETGQDPGFDADQVWDEAVSRVLDAVARFDEPALDAAYNAALALYPVEVVDERIVRPVLGALGEWWGGSAGGIAEEHFLSAYLRNKLGARFHHLSKSARGPRLVAACLPDELHELGLLMFCLSASEFGFRIVMLGAQMPLDQLVPAARAGGARGLVLSGAHAGALPQGATAFGAQLGALVRSAGMPVFVGGEISVSHARTIEKAGAIALGREFQAALERIDERLGAGADSG